MGKKSKKLIEESAYINMCGFTNYKLIPGFGQAISSGITAMHMQTIKENQQNRLDDSKVGQNWQPLT